MRWRWKGGLREAALAHVERLFAGEEAFAEDGFGALHNDAAMMLACILEEEVFDEAGVIDLVDVAAEDGEVDEVAEFLRGEGHVFGGYAAKETTGEEARKEWGARRISWGFAWVNVDRDRLYFGCGDGGHGLV
jgi:hypothetical protein